MGRLGIALFLLAAGLAALTLVSERDPARSNPMQTARLSRSSQTMTSPPGVELRRHKTRWTCSVRHATTGSYYQCTEADERKSCRCAIAKCKHWNPGQQQQCSSSCKCKMK